MATRRLRSGLVLNLSNLDLFLIIILPLDWIRYYNYHLMGRPFLGSPERRGYTMARRKTKRRRKGGGESISGYFKAIFVEKPALLKQRSNAELFERWLKDHPGHKEVPLTVKQGLSNIKSALRNKKRGKKGGKRGRPPKIAALSNGMV